MASLCSRCARRLQKVAASQHHSAPKRAFSSTTLTRRSLAKFNETTQPELDDILSTLRTKHFLPHALSNRERNLVFKPANKKLIEDNATIVTVGDEDFQLQHLDRMKDIPSRYDLIPQAIRLMAQGEKGKDWYNLPALLAGLTQAKMTPSPQSLAKMIYMATSAGRFGTILQCLHQAHNTGMSMRKNRVLNAVMWSLRHMARNDEERWSEAGLAKAIKDANEIASQLEDEEHGTGKKWRENDPRRRPYVLGTFLELKAVHAFNSQKALDVDGQVKAYAGRLLSNMGGQEELTVDEEKPQFTMLQCIPIWHGLVLAQKILGDDMPSAALALQITSNYESKLSELAQKVKKQKSAKKEGTFAHQAVTMWQSCIRD